MTIGVEHLREFSFCFHALWLVFFKWLRLINGD